VGCGYLGSRGWQKSDPVTHKSDIEPGPTLVCGGSDRHKAEKEPCSNQSFPAILDPKIGCGKSFYS
jgi:hypothetical protein